jgi:hypothetical protein
MPFVKLDIGILDSTLWALPVERDVFITALCMAKPHTIDVPMAQLDVTTGQPTGWEVPPGEYGFVRSSGQGIVRRAVVKLSKGLQALTVLGSPEPDSKSAAFEGRRLVRVDGGFIALNYQTYRDRDYTNAERQARYRHKRNDSNGVTNVTVTQAEVEADEELREERPTGAPEEKTTKPFAYPPSNDEAAWKRLAKACGIKAEVGETGDHFRKRVIQANAKRGDG